MRRLGTLILLAIVSIGIAGCCGWDPCDPFGCDDDCCDPCDE